MRVSLGLAHCLLPFFEHREGVVVSEVPCPATLMSSGHCSNARLGQSCYPTQGGGTPGNRIQGARGSEVGETQRKRES